MQSSPKPAPVETTRAKQAVYSRRRRTYNWIKRRRKYVALQFVRGVAYGAGAGGVGFLFWWIENR